MPIPSINLTAPGLFITATDTGVGKTVISCAIAHALKLQGKAVGVCKPLASGCLQLDGQLVSEDAQALAHFGAPGLAIDDIHPLRYRLPLAPAVAAEQENLPPDWSVMQAAMGRIEKATDCMLIEGVGGLLVPIDPADPQVTVLDLIVAVGYPVVIVARAGLGTLNHTSMTVQLLRQAGCRIAGVVLNGSEDVVSEGAASAVGQAVGLSGEGTGEADASMDTNGRWLALMNDVRILATVPARSEACVQPHRGVIDDAVLQAVGAVDWGSLMTSPTHA